MKIELIKRVSPKGTFYHIRVNGMTVNAFEEPTDANKEIDRIKCTNF